MHSCPRCGQSCDCNGDWDDIEVMKPEWVLKNCNCECDHTDEDMEPYEHDDFDCCDECDLPDACHDFGCALKQGLKPLINPVM